MRYLKNELLVFLALLVIAIVSFFGLIFEINKEFSYEVPAFGGTLKEGIIGSPRFINPLLAQTDADRSVASLIFSGLMRYDEEGKLTPALLEKYEISENGLEYTVTLKENLKWSNGKKLTVDDVIFTVQLAKNPLLQSPRRANWEGVEVNKIDNKTLLFRLQRQYAPFLDNLTLGILPKHLWEKVPPSQASFTKLNTEAVGAGPYKIKSTKRDSLGSIVSMQFSTNKNFVLGKPHIKTLILAFFKNTRINVFIWGFPKTKFLFAENFIETIDPSPSFFTAFILYGPAPTASVFSFVKEACDGGTFSHKCFGKIPNVKLSKNGAYWR